MTAAFLEWGADVPAGHWDLLVAADVMFSAFVVRPLLKTVRSACDASLGCVFLLASSFRSAELDADIGAACTELRLDRSCLVKEASEGSFLLIEEYRSSASRSDV